MSILQGLKARFLDQPFNQNQLVFDRYKVQRVLGAGSYGIAYLVIDLKDQEQMVLKQLRPSRKNTKQGRGSFIHETEILQSLDHPSIPKLIHSFEDSKHVYFTMEYRNGRNYEDLIFQDGETLSERESFSVISDILEIVQYLHENQIIHRDIRIPNVIKNNGKLSLIDFGLARRLDSNSAIFDDFSNGPFEKRLKREIHVKSDFYALGHFALFLLYSGYNPVTKKERSWEEELFISNDAKNVIRKMLQIDKPYESVKDLKKDLAQMLRSANE